MNNFIEFLDYKIELFDQFSRLGELSELNSLNECLIKLLCEMMCGIYLHHRVSQSDNICYHCIINGALSFQESMELPL
jgi:hypothetical protein